MTSHDDHDGPQFLDEEGEVNTLPTEFATATMGHVLLGQGRTDDARAIFRAVLERDPDDAEATRGLTLLGESRAVPAAEPVPLPASTVRHESSLRALAVDPTTVVAFWELDPRTLTRRGVPANHGAFRLVVVSLRQGAEGVTRDERHVDALPIAGEHFVTGLAPEATHHLALGAVLGAKWIPLARATPVNTPRDRPAEPVVTVGGQTPPRGIVAPTRIDATPAPSPAGAVVAHGSDAVFAAHVAQWQAAQAPSS